MSRDILGLCISHGQTRCGCRRNPDTDKSPAGGKVARIRTVLIGVAGALTVTVPVTANFGKRYKAAYKRAATSEFLRHYGSTIAPGKSMSVAGTVDDVRAIRAAFAKALPITGDKIPTEIFGINDNGRLQINGSVTMIKHGKVQTPDQYFWWPTTDSEWENIKKIGKNRANMKWFKAKIDDVS